MTSLDAKRLDDEAPRGTGAPGSWARWLLGALLCVGVLSCRAASSESLGGESNWLSACQSQAACGVGSCRCGVCTAACESDADCARLGGGVCVSVEHDALASGCDRAGARSLCLATCATNDCSPGTSCVDGACGATPSSLASEGGLLSQSVDGGNGPNTSTSATGMNAAPDASLEGSATGSRFDAGPGTTCGFEYLGQQLSCSTNPTLEPLEDATRLVDCMSECARRADCSAVVDEFWRGDTNCALVLSPCSEPGRFEDNLSNDLRVYRAACDATPSDTVRTIEEWDEALLDLWHRVSPDSACHFELAQLFVCEGIGEPQFEASVDSSFDACLAQCDARSDCTAVFEFVLEDGSLECVVYTGPCEDTRRSPEQIDQFTKVCE